MKVLYNVQVSNTTIDENGNPKWKLQQDACLNICKGIIVSLLDKYSDLYFTIKLPNIEDVLDIRMYEDLFDKEYLPYISFYEEYIPISPIESRFSFNFYHHKNHPEVFKDIDVCINDENTLTKNWRVLFNSLGLNIPIISTNYFLDSPISKKVPNEVRYYERQMEAFVCSDLAAFQCEVSKKEALDALKFERIYSREEPFKNSVWKIGASSKEVENFKTEKREVPVIYFANRITDTADRYTNWHVFAKAMGIVSKKEFMFDAYMLNPTKKITPEQLTEIMSLSEGSLMINTDKDFSRKDYLKFINSAHIGCSLFTNEVHGGVVHVETLLAGNILVAPFINNYREKFKDIFYPFSYMKYNSGISLEEHANDVAECILKALHEIYDGHFDYWSDVCKKLGYTESYENAADRIYNDMLYVINERLKK